MDPSGRIDIGRLVLNSARIALRDLKLPEMTGIYVENAALPVGVEQERVPLRRFLDREDLFILLFEDPALAYMYGELYRDDLMIDGGGNFLRYLKPEAQLGVATSEKGEFAADQTAFEPNSVFGAVVNAIARDDDILVCDDLVDEWADFIGLTSRAGSTIVSFYHAKYGELSLGASQFHVAISQGMKNLGRLSLPADALDDKIRKWTTDYSNAGVRTRIPRLLRGRPDALSADIDDARQAPDAVKRVCIVTSSLSRQQVGTALEEIRQGRLPDPHFVQLYWLLLSFFSACTEVGAAGMIICQE